MPNHVIINNKKYEYIYWKGLQKALRLFSLNILSGNKVSIDIETYARDKYKDDEDAALVPEKSKIRTIQMYDGETCVVVDFMEEDGSYSLLDQKLVAKMYDFFQSKTLIAHNALFETSHIQKLFTAHFNKVEPLNIYCTMNAFRLYINAQDDNPGKYKNSLEALTKYIFDLEVDKDMQHSEWGNHELTQKQLDYCAIDAILPFHLYDALMEGIEKWDMQTIYDLNTCAQEAIAHMRIHGMCIDTSKHDRLIVDWEAKKLALEDEIKTVYGIENPASTKQKSEWLRANLSDTDLEKWPVSEKSGHLKVDRDTLNEFSHIEVAAKFNDFNYFAKLYSTYGEGLKKHIVSKDGKDFIYSNFTLCKTFTGRMSSYNPNFQNMPRDKDIRSLFVPREDNRKLLCADFSQVELRVAAALSQDEVMCGAYENGKDLHMLTAAAFAQKDFDDVTEEERQSAKAINFGLIFGAGANTLQKYSKKVYGVELSDEDAQNAVYTFRETYPEYREWQLAQAHEAQTTGLITTPVGKVRRLDPDESYTRSMNTPIQGGAGEVMLLSIYKIWKFIQDNDVDAYLVNVVHDEVIIDCLDKDVEVMKKAIEDCMCEAFLKVFPDGCVRYLVKIGVGDNWAEAK